MDNSEITLNEMNDGLLTILKCPECSDIMVPPIYTCREMHTICTTCRNVKRCSACRNKSFERNYIMEKVAELVMYPCKYASAGCDVKLRLKDKVKHELDDCLLRRLPCLLSHCKLEVSRSDYLHHLNNTHLDSLIVGTDKVVDVSTHKESESEWVFHAFEHFFLFKFTTTSNQLQWTLFYEGSREGASQFYFTFSIKDLEKPYHSIQFSAKPITIEFADDSSDDDSDDSSDDESEKFTTVPLNVLQRYWNLENQYSIEIKVHKLP